DTVNSVHVQVDAQPATMSAVRQQVLKAYKDAVAENPPGHPPGGIRVDLSQAPNLNAQAVAAELTKITRRLPGHLIVAGTAEELRYVKDAARGWRPAGPAGTGPAGQTNGQAADALERAEVSQEAARIARQQAEAAWAEAEGLRDRAVELGNA